MHEGRATPSIHTLWDDLAHYPIAETEAAGRYLLTSLASWLEADNAAWIGTARLLNGKQALKDPLCGWRSRSLVFLQPPGEQEALLVRQILGDRRPEFGLTTIAMARLAGKFRVHRLRDGFVDWKALQKTLHYQAYYRQLGVHDRLWVGSPLTKDAESFFVFDKRNTKARFTAADARVASDAIRGLLWFQRQLMLSHGLCLLESPLTPMERRVLHLLLSEKSEKEIAAALKQSIHTTHGHIKQIYRKYGAPGRAALMAIWLSRR